MTHKHWVRIATLAAGLLPALALAHPGHGETSSFVAGALHPVSGVDHLAGFILVGVLAARLPGRHLWPMTTAFLGLLGAAWTSDSDGWRYAAGFMLMGAALIAAARFATGTATRAGFRFVTAAAPRSPTWAADAAPARRPCGWR
jgi:urease accessory protein